MSNAAAKKAAAELKAEQAARCQYEEKISMMMLELKDATSRCEYLEKITKPEWLILTRPCKRRKKSGPSLERPARRSGKRGRSRLVSPFYYKLSSAIRIMPRLIKCGVLQTHCWTCRRVSPMRHSFSKRKKDVQQKSCSGRNLACRSIRCC